MRFGSFQIWKCHEQIDSRGSTEFDSQDARSSLDTLRAEIVENRAVMQAFDKKVTEYFDEVYNNVAEINTTTGHINTKVDQIQIAINSLITKQNTFEVLMSRMYRQNMRMERKIDVNQ